MHNFDINVYKYSDDSWRLCPYTLVETDDGWGTGVELHKYNLELTDEEAQQLGLGNTKLWEESGILWEEDDWIDADTLVREFGLSDRILLWVTEVAQAIDKQATLKV